jgi:hypothetical protein
MSSGATGAVLVQVMPPTPPTEEELERLRRAVADSQAALAAAEAAAEEARAARAAAAAAAAAAAREVEPIASAVGNIQITRREMNTVLERRRTLTREYLNAPGVPSSEEGGITEQEMEMVLRERASTKDNAPAMPVAIVTIVTATNATAGLDTLTSDSLKAPGFKP